MPVVPLTYEEVVANMPTKYKLRKAGDHAEALTKVYGSPVIKFTSNVANQLVSQGTLDIVAFKDSYITSFRVPKFNRIRRLQQFKIVKGPWIGRRWGKPLEWIRMEETKEDGHTYITEAYCERRHDAPSEDSEDQFLYWYTQDDLDPIYIFARTE